MQNNYFFLRQLTRQLKDELIGFIVNEIYSQAKNELIISISKNTNERFIKAHLSSRFCCLSFPVTFSRARKNSVDLFVKIIGTEIIDVVQIENDRSFYFQFNNGFILLFKMHGNRANLLLIQNGYVVEIFRNNLKNDHSFNVDQLAKNIHINKKAFLEVQGNYKTLIPTLGKSFYHYFELKKYDRLDLDEKYNCVIELISYLKKPDFFIHTLENNLPDLTLIRKSKNDVMLDNPIGALNVFFKNYISISKLEIEKSSLKASMQSQIKKLERYIRKSSVKRAELISSTNYKHIGDLLMANLHTIKPYSKEVEVIDFLTQETVKILLKLNLSAQLNAEKYYKKAKKQQIEIDTLQKNIEGKENLKRNLEFELENIDKASTYKQVIKNSKLKIEQTVLPYNKVVFMDYDILIGKNAVKNEQLTFKVAKKDDLFLHAKNSSGSHVIVRKKAKQNFPKAVIEKAASYAAFYSKSKTETLCSVLYSEKKYVRKAKGAPPGAVLVEKERVLLVKPENF